MTARPARLAALTLACTLPLAACGTGENGVGASGTQTPLEVTTPTGMPKEQFRVEDTDKLVSEELTGEPVEDPAMDLTYKWQGSTNAPNGGSVIVVALRNDSDVPLPVDALKQPTLRYAGSGRDKKDATPQDAEASGVDIVGLDLPLRPGATINAKYAFDVAPGNLYNAEFTIGNVTFSGDLTG